MIPVDTAALVRIAQRLKALADPTRLLLLLLLGEGERCVGELVERVGGSQANVSKHLAVLRNAGLVRWRRDGMNVFYTVEDAAALEACGLMCGCLQREASRTMAQVGMPSRDAAAALAPEAAPLNRAPASLRARGTRPATNNPRMHGRRTR